MDELTLLQRISRKGCNPASLAAEVIKTPELVSSLLGALDASAPETKYNSEKVLRIVGERQPELLYPHFDLFVAMLDNENSFLKWGAIRNLANLTRADAQNRFESVFEKFFAPVSGPAMITAANAIGGSSTIAIAKPHLADRIADAVLKVEKAHFKTPECRNVAIGHAIDSFDRYFEHIQDKKRIMRFVKKQLNNTRSAVRKRAAAFLKKHMAPGALKRGTGRRCG